MKHFRALLPRNFVMFQKKANPINHDYTSVAGLQRLRKLEQENFELKRANVILQNTTRYLVQTLCERRTK